MNDFSSIFAFSYGNENFFPNAVQKDAELGVKYKTEMCRNWEIGFCEYGENCVFAHGVEELRSKTNLGIKYKTKKCKQFHEQGFCIYGSRCQFKHRDTADNTPNISPKNQLNECSKRRLRIFDEIEKRGELD